MKIQDIRVFRVSGRKEADGARRHARHCLQLDVYPEFRPSDSRSGGRPADGPRAVSAIYVEVLSDDGSAGMYGPISVEQAFVIRSKLRPFLIDRDPLRTELLWDQMHRLDRHGRGGLFMMAIGAVDCALWDLKGKHYNAPAYELLGGPTRERIRAYGSMGGQPAEPEQARAVAQDAFMRGFKAQKWFFRYGPGDGTAGMQKNLTLVRTLREALGDEAELMFDCVQSWDLQYAIAMAREMAPYRPAWLEEPLPANRVGGFARLKRETGIALAAGEHLYTRWDVKPYLEAGALDYVQVDPDWTGGISEVVKICALSAAFDVKVIPHAHNVLAAAQIVAAQPPGVCPMVEFLFHHLERQQYFHKEPLKAKAGWLSLPKEPGLAFELDEEKIEERHDLEWR